MLLVGFVPLVLWLWDRLLATGRPRYAAGFLAAYALHVAGGSYLAVMIHLPLAVLALNRLARRPWRAARSPEEAAAGSGRPHAAASTARRAAVIAATAVAAGAVFLAVYLPYLGTAQRFGMGRSATVLAEYGATLASFLTPPARSVYGALGDAFRRPENALFPGLAPLVLAGLGLVFLYRRPPEGEAAPETATRPLSAGKRWALAALAAAAVGALVAADLHTVARGDAGESRSLHQILTGWREPYYIFLGALLLTGLWRRWTGRWPFARLPRAGRPGAERAGGRDTEVWTAGLVLSGAATALASLAPLYAFLLHPLPGFGSIRVPARFHAFTTLTVAFLAAWGVEALLRRWRQAPDGRRAALLPARLPAPALVLALILALVLAVDLAPRPVEWEALPNAANPPPVYAWLAEHAGEVEALLELPMGDPTQDLRYMYRQMGHGIPLANGYSGFIPASYNALAQRCCWAAPDAEITAELRRLGVSHVVIHVPSFWGRPRRRAANAYAEIEGVELAWASPSTRVFRITPARPAPPAAERPD